MGIRSSCAGAMVAVLLATTLPDFALAATAPDCGPQFSRLTAANVIPSYRQVIADHKSRMAFHRSIPYDRNGKLETIKKHVHHCYRRIEGLLAPRAEAGEVEAQFVLGHLLVTAYNPMLGGHFPVDQEGENGRKRGHDWLVKADGADHFDAVELLIRYYSIVLDFSVEPHRGGALSDEPPQPWLPVPKEMLDWLKQAGPRGHPAAYTHLFVHYVKRYPYADRYDPANAQEYRELAEHYRQLSEQALDAAESSGGGD